MKKIIASSLIIIVMLSIYSYSNDIEYIIKQYKNGNYEQTAKLLESIKNKDARIYYYTGISYFKAGNEKKAKKYFLFAYYIAPKSRWGKAAYKNYVYLAKDMLHFLLTSGFGYDSNAFNSPDESSQGTGEPFADLYLKSSYNILPFGSLSYSYSRNQYFSDDISSNDNHRLGLELYKGNNELYVGSSYSARKGNPLNITETISYRKKLFGFKTGFRAVNRTYYDKYEYLTGFMLSGSILKKLGNTDIEYSYSITDANAKKVFAYVATGTTKDYTFSKEKSVKYFLSSSYNQHLIRIGNRFKLNKKISLKVSSSYRYKIYTDKNHWYKKYWLATDDVITHYRDSENTKWKKSPFEKSKKSRKDSRLALKIYIIYRISHNTDIKIAYLYEQNISNMVAGDIYDYNWSKSIPTITLYYNF